MFLSPVSKATSNNGERILKNKNLTRLQQRDCGKREEKNRKEKRKENLFSVVPFHHFLPFHFNFQTVKLLVCAALCFFVRESKWGLLAAHAHIHNSELL